MYSTVSLHSGHFFNPNQSHDEVPQLSWEGELADFATKYSSCFKLRTKSCAGAAYHYLPGLFLAEPGKRSIERMSERAGSLIEASITF
jgi:hypothetical protein